MSHYLDHAGSTPLAPGVRQAWLDAQDALSRRPGNPAALHAGGRSAKRLLEDARERVGAAVGASRAEVVFTSGATESDALALVAASRGMRGADARRVDVWMSPVEHDAVHEQGEVLRREGFRPRIFAVNSSGRVEYSDLGPAEFERAALMSMTWVCSELGTIEPVGEFASFVHDARADQAPLLHSDAAQAIGYCDVNFAQSGLDLLSIGGHKVGAPVGTGALIVRRGITMVTDRPGGGHERGIRSGTPDVAGACALATALEFAVEHRLERVQRAQQLRERLISGLPEGVRLSVDPATASAAIIHLLIPTHHPEAVLLAMDMAGVDVSAGSACHAGVTRPSRVVMALGYSEKQALGVLRVSTGLETTVEDIDAFLSALPAAIRAGQALDERDRMDA
ncbi:cysteine desulfurase family protein [Actinomyces sp. oral taxon 181]|uniref:cysteine desulfurase family protein n=1 Tax=Actinomyces sp. oral taxon 181 TaxID=712121 RepID=UPI0025C53FB9|nr:cysteine desulfurase family protein [Actinomyces sp. oral taxon 181]MBS5750973.1 cysteine desulfurase [Actinomyces sp. oral taxon 181]